MRCIQAIRPFHGCRQASDHNGFACGESAVRAAVQGQSGYMVKIIRNNSSNGSIDWSTGLQPLGDIANVEHFVPREWIAEDGFLPNEQFVEYAQPLVEGEYTDTLHVGDASGDGRYLVGELLEPAGLSDVRELIAKTTSKAGGLCHVLCRIYVPLQCSYHRLE